MAVVCIVQEGLATKNTYDNLKRQTDNKIQASSLKTSGYCEKIMYSSSTEIQVQTSVSTVCKKQNTSQEILRLLDVHIKPHKIKQGGY